MRKKHFLIFLLLILGTVLVLAGCEKPEETALGVVAGVVTDGRGGPGLEGAKVSWGDYSTTTDAEGYFELAIAADVTKDLFVTREDGGVTRVQEISVEEGQKLELEIPSRQSFNPNGATSAPVITVNVEKGQELSGEFTLDISVSGEDDTYLTYIYLAGEQRNPRTGFYINQNETEHIIDTTIYPNGSCNLKILVYDHNDNAALLIVPVKINNTADDKVLPESMIYMEIFSYTFGQNIVFYSDNLIDKVEAGLGVELKNPVLRDSLPKLQAQIEAAPAGATLFNALYFEGGAQTDGFKIYRSEDGLNYTLIGSIPATNYGSVSYGTFEDWSASLKANQTYYYQVVPYNSYGEGNAIERKVVTLPAITTYLESPANEATDVSLSPTFTWRNELSSRINLKQALAYNWFTAVTLYDATDYILWAIEVQNSTEVTYPGQLKPGGVYSWDVMYSDLQAIWTYDDYGLSVSTTAAGEYTTDMYGTGSINGEFIFTTTTATASND